MTQKHEGLTENDILTSKEVSKLLKVTNNTIRKWSREGKLKSYKLGGKGELRFLKKDVMLFLFGDKINDI